MAKYVRTVCGYVHEGDSAPEFCPVCKAPASKFKKVEGEMAWAAEHGIVSGVSDSAFAPNGAITREQLAVMLYRYAQYKGYDVSKTADLSGYADQGSISDWAAQAVQWACGSGLMTGRSANSLAPAGTLTRAEAATMLKAFCENVKK